MLMGRHTWSGGRRGRACILTLALLLSCGVTAIAQDLPENQSPATQPTTQADPTAAPPPTEPPPQEPPPPATQEAVVELVTTEITPESIQSHITRIESDASIPAGAKTEAINLLKQALEQLNLAATWSARIEEFSVGIKGAGDDLDSSRRRLAMTTQPSTAAAPDSLEDKSITELTQELNKAEAALEAKQEEELKFADVAKERTERRQAIPEQLAEANRRLEAIRKSLASVVDPATHPQVAQARRLSLQAQRRAVAEEIRQLQIELQFYEVRAEILATRREEARLAVVSAQARLEPLRQIVDRRRQQDVERQEELARREGQAKIEEIRKLAEENKRLAAEQAELAEKISRSGRDALQASQRSAEIDQAFIYLQENISRPGMTALIGPLMRKKKAELHDLYAFERQVKPADGEYSRVVLRLEEIGEQQLELANNVELEVRAIVDAAVAAEPSLTEHEQEVGERVRELLSSRQAQLTGLGRDYNAYLSDLTKLITAHIALSDNIKELDAFIAERILWIRSAPPLHQAKLPTDLADLPGTFVSIGRAFLRDMRNNIALYASVVLLVGALVVFAPRIHAEVLATGERVSKVTTDSFARTILGLAGTVILSAIWPGATLFLGSRLLAAVNAADLAAYDLGAALSIGVRNAAIVWFTSKLLRLLFMSGGLGEVHFRWDAMTLKRLQTNLAWFQLPAVLLVLLVSAMESYPPSGYRDTLGRIGYIALIVMVLMLARRLLHPAEGIIATKYRKDTDHWMYRVRHVWYGGAILVLAALVVSSAVGFQYTATALTRQLGRTLWFGLEVLLVHGLLARWVFFHQRRMVLDVARKKRAAAAAAKPGTAEGGAPATGESTIDVEHMIEQTLRLLRSAALVVLVIGLWLIWADMLPAIGFLNDIEVWRYTQTVAASEAGQAGEQVSERAVSITLAHIMLSVLTGMLTFVLARNIPGLLEIAVLRHFRLDIGARYAITTITRYVITVVGMVVAFNVVGIGWSKVQWLAAAITVGLGFGLQEIFANFVSGLMLLFERPIRIGDTVTVGDVSGTVARIRIRATTITGWDRKELVIPNKEFVTGQFINWTLTDSILRIIVPVGIAYGSDVELAMATLKRLVDEQPTVVSDPEARVLFVGFGESALNLEVRAFIGRIDDYLKTISELHCAIDREFRKAGVEIAFPQRDIHVRSIKAMLPMEYHRAPAMLQPDAPAIPLDNPGNEA